MSNDDVFGRRLRHQTAPPARYREEMWQVVSRSWSEQAAGRRRRRAARVWATGGFGLAAALVVGIFIGRMTSDSPPAAEPYADAALVVDEASVAPSLSTSYRVAIGEHLREAETLLVLFESTDGGSNAELVRFARELAGTTRLLMDSRAGRDAEVRAMLLDLELLLMQIARLVDDRDPVERQAVRESVEQSGVLARLRVMTSDPAARTGI